MRQNGSPPPYNTSSSEVEPLIGLRKPSRRQFICICAVLITLSIVTITIVIFLNHPSNDPLDPGVRDRIRKEWDVEVRQHQQEVLKRDEIYKRWRLEDNERIHLREQWQTEIENHGRDMEERRKHEEEERLRLNMFWTNLDSHACTTYATREYTARLANVPTYYDRRVEACMATSVKIHGVEYTPKWCEDHGPGKVIGHWEVDQHEPDCASYWTRYKDFGCMSPGSGQRRVEHYLENIPLGGDWKEYCATTPVRFRGMHFTGAQFCFQKDHATWGHWIFDDERCK
ncbi:hypothetical protein BDR04DRAFT_1101441 [Suillus decipiens]|nr:hypothetical protein BDR04DRAFT_1101441 [Suillus decipiens]